jgi:hypothetical protein
MYVTFFGDRRGTLPSGWTKETIVALVGDARIDGCITARISAPAASGQQLTTETSSAIGFTTREQLRQALSQRSDGRLELDPDQAR